MIRQNPALRKSRAFAFLGLPFDEAAPFCVLKNAEKKGKELAIDN